MKLFRILLYVGPFCLWLLLTTPAVAQFEVNPDHFDNQPQAAAKKPVVVSKKKSPAAQSTNQAGVKSSSARTAGTVSSTTNTRRRHAGKPSPRTLVAVKTNKKASSGKGHLKSAAASNAKEPAATVARR